MKVAFFSNYLNHHQLPFCLAMDRLTDGQFTFVATTPVPKARLALGYHDMNKQIESDVIITGSAPEIYTMMRIKEGKLTFRYSERIYKRGIWRMFSPRGLYFMLKHHRKYRKDPLYMLCASAYTSFDYALTGS